MIRSSRSKWISGIGAVVLIGGLVLAIDVGVASAVTAPPNVSVKVVNTPSDPVPVTLTSGTIVGTPESSNPFQKTISVSFAGGSGSSADLVTVPTGKRLIVEFASFSVILSPGDQLYGGTLIDSQSNLVHHIAVPPGVTLPNGSSIFTASQPLLMYIEAGHTLKGGLGKTTTAAANPGDVTVSGYFVDVP